MRYTLCVFLLCAFVWVFARTRISLDTCCHCFVTFHPKEPNQSLYNAIPHTFNHRNPTMCNPTNLDKNNVAAAVVNSKTLRRIHRRSPTTVIAPTLCASTVEETTQRAMLAESKTFTATLNDIDCQPSEKNSTQKRLGARRGGRRPRPDARGRIGNKECHTFAFVEQFEEMIRPDATGWIGNKECHAFAFAEQIEEEISML